MGKSTLIRMIYGNYLTQAGEIRIGGVDLMQAKPRDIIALRREVLGYLSQFLRIVPRLTTRDVVAELLRAMGASAEDAQARAQDLLRQLNVTDRLWSLLPATSPGGEQERVKMAHGFAHA